MTTPVSRFTSTPGAGTTLALYCDTCSAHAKYEHTTPQKVDAEMQALIEQEMLLRKACGDEWECFGQNILIAGAAIWSTLCAACRAREASA